MSDERRKRNWWLLIVLLPLLYVLSYAPVVRWRRDTPVRVPLYASVEWLIDHGYARDEILWWCNLWGVQDAAQDGSILRYWTRRAEPVDFEP